MTLQPSFRIGAGVQPGKWLRAVTIADGKTVHDAFFDRSFAQ